MKNNVKLIGLLNDLIKVNNDRYNAYATLLTKKVTHEGDLSALVCNLAAQSRGNSARLIKEVIKLIKMEATSASHSAGIYSEGLGLKEPIPVGDRYAMFEGCKHREEIIQKVYYDALSSGIELTEEIASLIDEQKKDMKAAGSLFMTNHASLSNAA